jgi:hypothetical protein
MGTKGLPAPVIIQRTGLALIGLPSKLAIKPVAGPIFYFIIQSPTFGLP